MSPPFYEIPIFWAVVLTLLPFLLFTFRYAAQPWRTTLGGKSIMFLAGSIVAVLGQSVINAMIPDYPAKDVVRIFLLAGVSMAGWNLYITLERLQRDEKKKLIDDADKDPPVIERRVGVERRRNLL